MNEMFKQELVNKSLELFMDQDKWNSFVELSNLKVNIINEWFSLLKENVKEHYSQNKINNWSFHHQNNDFQFYFSYFDKVSPISLWVQFTGGGIIISLHASKNVDKCWDIIEKLDLKSSFPNYEKPSAYLFWEKIEENLTYEQLAWYAGNKTEELRKIITDKIELITSDSKITTLLKELNTL